MEPTEAEKLKGRRTQVFLILLTVVMIAAPVILYLFRRP
jgi:hypothetical protein